MAEKAAAAFGIFPDRTSIENVVSILKREGFRHSDVSVLFRENRGTWEQTQRKNTIALAAAKATSTTVGSSHGALRWLSGIGAVAVPGHGTYVAVGPVRAALEGTAFGGTHGALVASLIVMGVPESHAKQYEDQLANSWFLLSVHYSDPHQMTKAKQILDRTLAQDVLTTNASDAEVFISPMIPEASVASGAGMGQKSPSK